MNIYCSNGIIAWPDDDVEIRGDHIWIKTITYKFTVYSEPVDGTIVESTAQLIDDEIEVQQGL